MEDPPEAKFLVVSSIAPLARGRLHAGALRATFATHVYKRSNRIKCQKAQFHRQRAPASRLSTAFPVISLKGTRETKGKEERKEKRARAR